MALFKKKRPYQLTGLVVSPDGLYDGSYLIAAARWWNHVVETMKSAQAAGYAPLTPDDVRLLVAIPQPENRKLLEGMADLQSMPGRQSQAVLCLAYAFATVVTAAVVERSDSAWVQAPPLEPNDMLELMRHYNQEGWAYEIDAWPPYWTVLDEQLAPKIVEAVRASFDDQVDRWSSAEGGWDLRQSLGEPDWSLSAAMDDDDMSFPTWVDLLFEWGGRLRLGEQLVASGGDWRTLRFARDELDPSEMFYEEAYGRYMDMAVLEDPVSPDIVSAVQGCVRLFGEDLDEQGRLGLSTIAIRGYLWRTAEQGPVHFLEPDLSESVERSLTVGDDRSPGEPMGYRLYMAAFQCMEDGVKVRMGSIGGYMSGPRHYEMAFWDTTESLEEDGVALDEDLRRSAFQFGVCLADAERVLSQSQEPH